MGKRKWRYLGISAGCLAVLAILTCFLKAEDEPKENSGTYYDLTADESSGLPLEHLSEDFYADADFSSHLPLVVIHPEKELPVYKEFTLDGQEIVYKDVEPWASGTVRVIDSGRGNNRLSDPEIYQSPMKIKLRGHSSIRYAKKQYYFKLTDEQGQYKDGDLLGMGAGNGWVLNGSQADKSMMRNYLAYRIASEIGGNNMAMDSRYCEVFTETDKGLRYEGLYLLTEAIERGKARIDIESAKKKNIYTSYIVRRDRFTSFDPMLETYGRLNGLSKEWIGVKYPGKTKMTPAMLRYIQEDFSHIEQVIYSEDTYTFMSYKDLIDRKSFIDYFLINEFFGNYDAGEHSNYMYKDTGGRLCVGPVWDFDQAMNNSIISETDPSYIALNTKAFYARLTRDSDFVSRLKKRHTELSQTYLSTEHVFSLMEQTQAHISKARLRDWYRWEKYYTEKGHGSYVLGGYDKDGTYVERFNVDYDQELYVIRTYLRKHSQVIQQEMTQVSKMAATDASLLGQKEILLTLTVILFLVPAYLINKRG